MFQTLPTALLDYIRQNGTELLGFVTGAACVWLIVRQNIWNWPLGIANNVIFIGLFLKAGLYADVGLQGFYILIGAYGWWHWLHGGVDHGALKVSRIPAREALITAFATGLGIALLVALLRRCTNSTVPVADATVTGLSIAAQLLMARKRLENWLLWIVANCLSIGLLIFKHLYITAGLYSVFLAMCVVGFREWWRALRREQEAA